MPERLCALCGLPVEPEEGFEVLKSEGGPFLAHDDCFAFTHSASGTGGQVPDRMLPKGVRPVHTCGDPRCLNPRHLTLPN